MPKLTFKTLMRGENFVTIWAPDNGVYYAIPPQLLMESATIDDLKKSFPEADFEGVRMVTVALAIDEDK